MKKIPILFILLSLLLLNSCTNTNDEDALGPAIIIEVNDFTATIDENPSVGQVIGVLNVSVNRGDLSFVVINQNPSEAIEISAVGEVLVKEPLVFDFETNQQITAQIEVSSGGNSKALDIEITLNDVSENDGLTVNNFTKSVFENPENGEIIGTLSASSTNGSVTFNLINQLPEGAVSVGSTSGEITVARSSLFVFTENPTIAATVEVTDGEEIGNITITINLLENLTIWTGAKTSFTKGDGADPNQEANQDRITDNVWITRGNSGGQIYNVKVESGSSKSSSPTDTEWAQGTTADIESLTFLPFRNAVSPKSAVGKDLVLHLITDDVYIDVKFTQWSTGRRGGFAYERSTDPN